MTTLKVIESALAIDGFESGVEKFSSILAKKIGTENETVQNIAYAATMMTILEISQNVLGIGAGFTKLDMTGMKLAQIQAQLKRIEKKMDKMLKAPLNMSIDFFQSAVRMIETNQFEKAYEKFKDVEKEATKAFHYAVETELSVNAYTEVVKAIRLLVFSKIAIISFDCEKKMYVPCVALDEDKAKLMGVELSDLVNKCLVLKSKVSTSGFFVGRETEKKNKKDVQDLLDSILKVAYPYISQGCGWTKKTTKLEFSDLDSDYPKISEVSQNLYIQVQPKFIPEGQEDKTEITVGMVPGEAGYFAKVKIWREENQLFSTWGPRLDLPASYETSDQTMTMKVRLFPEHLVLSASADFSCAEYLGQYIFDRDLDCWKQVMTERGGAIYLYPVGLDWYIGMEPGETEAGVFMKDESETKGWDYVDGASGQWQEDSARVDVVPGLMSLCETVTITSTEENDPLAAYLGEFSRCEDKWFYGRPVFVNNNGKVLCCGVSWQVGDSVGDRKLEARSGPNCPGKIEGWKKQSDKKKMINYVIRCSSHEDIDPVNEDDQTDNNEEEDDDEEVFDFNNLSNEGKKWFRKFTSQFSE